MSSGSEFQTVGPATEKARRSYVLRFFENVLYKLALYFTLLFFHVGGIVMSSKAQSTALVKWTAMEVDTCCVIWLVGSSCYCSRMKLRKMASTLSRTSKLNFLERSVLWICEYVVSSAIGIILLSLHLSVCLSVCLWCCALWLNDTSYCWWHSVVVSGVGLINEVNRHCARLVLGWVTVCRRVNHLGL